MKSNDPQANKPKRSDLSRGPCPAAPPRVVDPTFAKMPRPDKSNVKHVFAATVTSARFTSFDESDYVPSSRNPTWWTLEPLKQAVQTLEDLVTVIDELQDCRKYGLGSADPDESLNGGDRILNSIWALARRVDRTSTSGSFDLDEPRSERKWVDGWTGTRSPNFTASDVRDALSRLRLWASRAATARTAVARSLPPLPVVSISNSSEPANTSSATTLGDANVGSVQYARQTLPPATNTSIRPAGWPDDKCPVDLTDPRAPKIYRIPVEPLKGLQLKAMKELVAAFNKRVVTVGSLKLLGVHNAHKTIGAFEDKPHWKEVIVRPGSGGSGGYRIEHAV